MNEMNKDELIKQVTQHAGIPADKAKLAADSVVTFLKSKLPAPVAGQIDSVTGGRFADVTKKAGDFMGSKDK